MNQAGRLSMMGGRWKNPYVTDGLVAMWDGEWNAGGGKSHDVITNGWVDCVGGLTFDMSGCSIAEDGGIYINANMMVAWDGVVPSYNNVTVQYVAHMAASLVSNSLDAGLYFCSNGIVIGRTNAWGNGGNVPARVVSRDGNRIGSYAVKATWSKFREYHTWTSVAKNTSPTFTAYMDDEALETTQLPFYTSTSTADPQFRISATNKPLYVKCFRAYSRALTAAEIAANYTVDKARFNLP